MFPQPANPLFSETFRRYRGYLVELKAGGSWSVADPATGLPMVEHGAGMVARFPTLDEAERAIDRRCSGRYGIGRAPRNVNLYS